MNADMVISLVMEALKVSVLVSGPMLLFGLVVGLIVSIFQAVTQIQETTLAFVPKILAIVVSIAIFFPWMVQLVVSFTSGIILNLNAYVGKV
jgi:flagellar biosynthetic protein FliQ